MLNWTIDLDNRMGYDDTVPLTEKVIVYRRHDPRTPNAPLVVTNVPWVVISHSPDGFEWNYFGSGPADFALNVLENILPFLGYDMPESYARIRCYRNDCSRLAWALHQEFKSHFIASLPKQGGEIGTDSILTWLQEPAQQETARRVLEETAQARQWASEEAQIASAAWDANLAMGGSEPE